MSDRSKPCPYCTHNAQELCSAEWAEEGDRFPFLCTREMGHEEETHVACGLSDEDHRMKAWTDNADEHRWRPQ